MLNWFFSSGSVELTDEEHAAMRRRILGSTAQESKVQREELLYEFDTALSRMDIDILQSLAENPNIDEERKTNALFLLLPRQDGKINLDKKAEVFRCLLNHGAEPNNYLDYHVPVLYHAVSATRYDPSTIFIQHLLAKGADVNARSKGLQNTVLHYVARQGAVELAKLLIIDHRADVNAKNEEGQVPLAYALQAKQKDCALCLIILGGILTEPVDSEIEKFYESTGLKEISDQWRTGIKRIARCSESENEMSDVIKETVPILEKFSLTGDDILLSQHSKYTADQLKAILKLSEDLQKSQIVQSVMREAAPIDSYPAYRK